ncbi:hypothetical protein HZC53_05165 [Candidatus Uhrbacteria bacterium]|nr:hypothetical protein [Candidatus Uhrbacteria bacterium]
MDSCVRRLFPGAVGALIVFIVLLIGRTAAAGNGCDCICERGKATNGIRVVMSNKPGCRIYQAVKQYPQIDPSTKLPYPEQIQFRSIFAANLEKMPDGTYERRGVLRGCTKDGKPSPDADTEEKKCKQLSFYYALDGVEITIPTKRVFTPSEQAEIDAAAAAAKKMADEAAAQKADEDRRELAAEKHARELEKQLKVEQDKTKAREDELAAIQEIAWRARFFTTAVIVVVSASLWSLLTMLAAMRYRFKLRPITVDGYRYPDPISAVKDVALKMSGVRTEAQEAKDKLLEEQTESRVRIAALEQKVAAHQTDSSATATMMASIRKERDGYKSTLEALRLERGQATEDLKAEIAQLKKQNEDLLAAWNDVDEARIQLEGLRRRQVTLLMEAQAENEKLSGELATVRQEKADIVNELEIMRFVRKPESIPPSIQVDGMMDLALAMDDQQEAVTNVLAPALPPTETPYRRHQTASYPIRDLHQALAGSQSGDRPSSTETPSAAGSDSELAIYRQGFEVLENSMFWGRGDRPSDMKLEDRVKRIVETVNEACSCMASVKSQTSRPPAFAADTFAPRSNSDIVRVAALMGTTDDFDLPGFQRSLSGASNANAADCLKTCVYEWARRVERHGDSLIYAIDMPYELYDLHAFLDSQLLYGEGIVPLVPDEFVDKLYQVKHVGDPAFARRPRMSSFPPSAMAPVQA